MKLNIIIKEEISSFLGEAKEHEDNEIVDFQSIDLQQEYNKYNSMLFNNQLPRVPMRWSNRKTSLGHVKYLKNNYDGQIKIQHLAMSGFYQIPYSNFKSTLAHEMIHVKLLTTGQQDRWDAHGTNFMNEAKRINDMGLGFNVTAFNTENFGVSDKTKENMKTLIAIIMEIDSNFFVSVTTPNVFTNDMDYIFNLFEKLVQRGKYHTVEITAVESKNPELLKYKTNRTYRTKISYAKISDELLEQLLNDRVIKTAKFVQGQAATISEENNMPEWSEHIIV
jgi:hypothetical protein